MTTAVPPPSATPPPPPTPAQSLTVSVPDPPAALQKLPPGTQVPAVVAEARPDGEVSLQTAYGRLRAVVRAALPPRTELVLQVRSSGTPLQLQVLSVDGRPPAAAGLTEQAATLLASRAAAAANAGTLLAAQIPDAAAHARGMGASTGASPATGAATGTATGTGSTTAPLGGPPAAPVQLVPGTTLAATLLRPLPMPGGSPAGSAPSAAALPSATGMPGPDLATPAAAVPPGAATASPTPAAPGGAMPEGMPPAGGPQAPTIPVFPDQTATAPAALPAGTRLTLRILATPDGAPAAGTKPSAATLPSPTPLPDGRPATAGTTLTAVVSGVTRAGQPTVKTPIGVLALQTRAPMPAGTTVTLLVTEDPVVPSTPSDGLPHGFGGPLLADNRWPAMEDMVRTLAAADPQVAQQVTQTVLPQPDSRLAAMLINFVTALRGGDVGGWLGDGPQRLLERIKPSLAAAVAEEFRHTARVASHPISGDWRLAVIPFADGQQIRPIRMLVRRRGDDGKEDGDTPETGGTRFVFDIDTTRHGRMQLDGLLRNRNKRFDLIIRSATPMPVHMRTDIRRIFADANAITGIIGSIGFQSDPPGFIDLPPDAYVDDPLGLTV